MTVKFVNEYVEEICDMCYEFKWGVFVEISNRQICKCCCDKISKELKIYELEKE